MCHNKASSFSLELNVITNERHGGDSIHVFHSHTDDFSEVPSFQSIEFGLILEEVFVLEEPFVVFFPVNELFQVVIYHYTKKHVCLTIVTPPIFALTQAVV